LSDQIQKKEMDWAYITYGREKRYIQGLVAIPEGKRPLGSPRRRCK
jgi:hypothetical protein